MAEPRRFPYKGRRLSTFEATDGTTLVTYEADQQVINNIKTKYGQEFIYGNTVYVAEYAKGDSTLKTVPDGPAGDQDILGGISNVDLVASMNSDPNFYRQATGTTTQSPVPNPDQQGGSTPVTQPTADNKVVDTSLVYPEDLGSNTQDRIMFQAFEYSPGVKPGERFGGPFGLLNPVKYVNGKEMVFLPIQSSITDQNSVGWESDTLNPIEVEAGKLSISLMETHTQNLTEVAGKKIGKAIQKAVVHDENVRTYLVGQAIGVNNLQSRLLGQVLNPNLELLFQGPQLRPFNYTFKMSARSSTEANTIKKIIKYFKQNMATKKGTNVFLKAPNVFKIQYQYGNSRKEHKSLNLIKVCALTNCSVDYTPLGTYMTYSDVEGTMVAYTMTLSFQELTPIYDEDYLTGDGKDHSIGY